MAEVCPIQLIAHLAVLGLSERLIANKPHSTAVDGPYNQSKFVITQEKRSGT
jgi:hypothetical protein